MEKVDYNSDEAAKFVTGIEGWVDRDGRFWGKNEHMARWSGCTHKPCEDCSDPTPKSYIRCEKCREKKEIERYEGFEKRVWDGKSPVYSQACDEWFFDKESIWEYLHEHEATLDSLRLLTSRPQYLREIDIDYFVDDLPEDDHHLPDGVQEAMDALNKEIRKAGPVSWVPDKYAAIVEGPSE